VATRTSVADAAVAGKLYTRENDVAFCVERVWRNPQSDRTRLLIEIPEHLILACFPSSPSKSDEPCRPRLRAIASEDPVVVESCDWVHEMKDGCIIASHPRAIPGSIV
jgi:hypothetical protein